MSPTALEMDLKKAFSVWADYAHLKFARESHGVPDIAISFKHGQHGDA